MTDVEDSLHDVEQRQKKEKKELQSKIQSLKKSVGKGDKKKKKDVLDEILKMETELTAKHLSELSIIKDKYAEDLAQVQNDTLEVENNKVSKAQKRRDKKAAQEKALAVMISKQEEENVNGPRNLEFQSINTLLKDRGLILSAIPSNGDCLYSAVSHQMNLIKNSVKTVDQLRKLTAEHLRQHKNQFLPFLTNNTTGEMLNDDEFEEYCNKIENTKSWGGQIELQALCEILKNPIHIIQSLPPHVIVQGESYPGEPLVITYHRHMYGLGEHYNSTNAFYTEDES